MYMGSDGTGCTLMTRQRPNSADSQDSCCPYRDATSCFGYSIDRSLVMMTSGGSGLTSHFTIRTNALMGFRTSQVTKVLGALKARLCFVQ